MHTNLEIKTKTHCKGGGGQKSGVLDRGPRGSHARISAKFRKTFFLVVDAQDSSAAGDCCGEVSRSNRGSFLVAKAMRGATGREAARSRDLETLSRIRSLAGCTI